MAWRLGILEDPNSLELIPEGILLANYVIILDGEPAISTRQHVKKQNPPEQFAQEQESEPNMSARSKEQSHLYKTMNVISLSKKARTRYKMLLVFSELVELSEEFLKAGKITLAYNFLGLESRIVLNATASLKKDTRSIPINKLRLYYFFSDSASQVNEVLRQKDVQFHALTPSRRRESSCSSTTARSLWPPP